MAERDSFDFVAAFAVGALVGAGAALLLRPKPATRTERALAELEPYRRKARQAAQRAGRGLSRGMSAAAERGEQAASGGRERVSELRGEVADLVAAARKEIGRTVAHQVKDARRALKKTARRLGR